MVNPSVMRLSKSKVGAWEWCQYSWALQNILNIQGSMHTATTTGIDAHQMVEDYYNAMMAIESEDEIIPFVEEYIPTNIPNDNMDAIEHLDACIELDLARLGALKEAGHCLLTYGKPIGIENYIRLDDDNTTQHSEFSGMIDLAFRELDGGVGIYDLKTGRDKGIENHRFELMIYKWLWEESHPGDEVTAVGIIWSKTRRVQIEEPTTRSYNSALRKVQRVRDRIAEAHKNATEENPLAGFKKALRNPVPCSWCAVEHKKICWKEEYDIDIS